MIGVLVVLLVVTGGGVGAAARWGIQEAWELLNRERRIERGLRPAAIVPWPTMLANVLACFVLGLVIPQFGSPSTPGAQLGFSLFSTGFCGGMSTVSFLALDTVRLLRRGAAVSAIGYLTLTCGLCMAAFWLGLVIVL